MTVDVPEHLVPEWFRARVRVELREARRRALEVMPVAKVTTGPAGRTYRRVRGQCAGCGCPLDENVLGCRNCQARHHMRGRVAAA